MNCDFSSGTPVWAVRVRAVDSKWKRVDGLHSSDFKVTANRLAPQLCGFTSVRYPASIGIILDASGSMEEGIPQLLPGMEQIFKSSGPQDEFFLITANDTINVPARFTNETSLIRAGFAAKPKGRTKVFDGLYASMMAMKAAHHPLRAIIMLSDGGDNESALGEEILKKTLLASPLPVFWIVPPRDERPEVTMKMERVRNELAEIVKLSHGYVLRMDELKDFLTAASGLDNAIHAPYELLFQGPQWQTRPEVQVRVNGVSPRPRLFTEMASQAQR